MAAQFLASHGVNIDAVMSEIQYGKAPESKGFDDRHVTKIVGARLPCQDLASLWDVSITHGVISAIERHEPSGTSIEHLQGVLHAHGNLLAPSLCHAHVHLDKCFLLQDPKYADLPIVKGDFSEAMELTGKAKERFEEDDLLRRGGRLIEESIEAGVTALRAFVEVDEIVGMECVNAAAKLKEQYESVCEIQICAFAQLALLTGEDGGARRRELMEQAMRHASVDVLGSTPYVEEDEAKMKQNIGWIIEKAMGSKRHLDLHLDYNLDPPRSGTPPMIWHVADELKRQGWNERNGTKTVCLGHCTRLTQFPSNDLKVLRQKIEDLPVSFVGLPMSDLFMMGRVGEYQEAPGMRQRGTLQIPHMIQQHGFNGAISINNVGNAFTPHGSCDPLALASFGVGVYHAGTQKDTEVLYECVSTRAKKAIGLPSGNLELRVGDEADLLLIGTCEKPRLERKSVSEVVYDPGRARQTIRHGLLSTV